MGEITQDPQPPILGGSIPILGGKGGWASDISNPPIPTVYKCFYLFHNAFNVVFNLFVSKPYHGYSLLLKKLRSFTIVLFCFRGVMYFAIHLDA